MYTRKLANHFPRSRAVCLGIPEKQHGGEREGLGFAVWAQKQMTDDVAWLLLFPLTTLGISIPARPKRSGREDKIPNSVSDDVTDLDHIVCSSCI